MYREIRPYANSIWDDNNNNNNIIFLCGRRGEGIFSRVVRGGCMILIITKNDRIKIFSVHLLAGECCTLRYRNDITRANQKPLLYITRTNHLAHLAVFDIVINLRRP